MGGFNGSGTMVYTHNWVTDKGNNVKITASRMDAQFADVKSALELCLIRDGQNVMSGDLDLNGQAIILDADADTTITADSDDRIDIRIGGTDAVLLGHDSTNSSAFALFDPAAFTAQANTSVARVKVGASNAVTVPTGTTALAAGLHIAEPNFTATGTITNAATVYIADAPTEGGTGNYALWVDAGESRFDGTVTFNGSVAGVLADVVDDTTPQLGGALDTNGKAVNFSEGAAVASASAPNIWAGDGNTLHITGTTTITDFADAPRIGASRWLVFDDALTLTHGSGITLPGGANITTAAGDMAYVYADAVDAFRTQYFPAAGAIVTSGTWTPVLTFTTPGDLSVAYSVQVASYTKIGDIVNVQCVLTTSTFTHGSASGNLRVTGLPFATESGTARNWHGALVWGGITKASYTNVVALAVANTSYVEFYASGSGQVPVAISSGDVPSGGTIRLQFTLTYRTA